jgi:hypothetical protein
MADHHQEDDGGGVLSVGSTSISTVSRSAGGSCAWTMRHVVALAALERRDPATRLPVK